MTSSPAQRVRERLPGAVLLAIGKGKKNPTLTGWQKVQPDAMADPAYLDTLNHGGNIGVLLGKVSGGLCAIDFDADADADAFLAMNPRLAGALRTRGARGCQIWLRAQGVFPPSGDAKDADGRKVAEWRADGRQSVVWGVHPSGVDYKWVIDAPPADVHFQQLRWPVGWRASWLPEPEDLATLAERRLVSEHGAAFTVSERGKVTINSMYFVARHAAEHDVLFEPSEGSFYVYHAACGLWRPQTAAALAMQFAEDLKTFADAQEPADSK